MFDGDQRVVELDEVVLAVALHVEDVELQTHPVAGLRPQLPAQEGAGSVGGVWKPWRLQHSRRLHVVREGFLI